jgi:hypothetical protein
MPHEPRLTVYTLEIKPSSANIERSNRFLCKCLTKQVNEKGITDSVLFLDLFKKFISDIDNPEMYSDPVTKKCMTANQAGINDNNLNANIHPHSENFIIEGKVEGGNYGKRRKKTSTLNKSINSVVEEKDAITDDFYFMLYIPFGSYKITLFLQSYTDESIDSVMKKFWTNFFTVQNYFETPKIKRFIPKSIIEDFKKKSTVNSLTFSTDIAGETLLGSTYKNVSKHYKITIQIKPTKDDLTIDEYEKTVPKIKETFFTKLMTLGQFKNQKGSLRDSITNKTSSFDLATSFDVKPSILLSKYITLKNDESDFERIKQYCFKLLEVLKTEIYNTDAIKER